MPTKTNKWRYLIQTLAVCVLLFSVHAKLAQFQRAVSSPSTASKLWLNEAPSPDRDLVAIAWPLTFAGIVALVFGSSSLEFLFQFPVPRRVSSFQMRLHLRPPPQF